MPRREEKINAGVVLATRFIQHFYDEFTGYIDYMDRDEATRNEGFSNYSVYNDYMDNPEKTSGLFDGINDNLSKEQIQSYKREFEMAQENKSVMWQNVISFDNRYLEKYGLLDKKTGTVNEERLIELARLSMIEFLDSENLSNSAIWTGAIHYNTEHIHIHFAIVEPEPTRTRGKIKQSSFAKAKSKVINNIMDLSEIHKEIGHLLSDRLVENAKHIPRHRDAYFEKEFFRAFAILEESGIKYWQYGGKEMKNFRPMIDKLTDIHVNSFSKAEYKEFKRLIDETSEKYTESYGQSKQGKNFAEGKEKEFYRDMGNVILKQMREVHNELERKKHMEEFQEDFKKKNYRSIVNSNKVVSKLKKLLNDERDSYVNQMYYQRMVEKNI